MSEDSQPPIVTGKSVQHKAFNSYLFAQLLKSKYILKKARDETHQLSFLSFIFFLSQDSAGTVLHGGAGGHHVQDRNQLGETTGSLRLFIEQHLRDEDLKGLFALCKLKN